MRIPRPAGGLSPALFAFILLLSASAPGQTLLHRLDGAAAGDRAGWALGGGFDVDGDGVPDLIVGQPEADVSAADCGVARVYSGASATQIRRFVGVQGGAHFGAAVEIAGDLDGDGCAELLVGAPLTDLGGTDCGRAYLYSGASGQLQATFSGS